MNIIDSAKIRKLEISASILYRAIKYIVEISAVNAQKDSPNDFAIMTNKLYPGSKELRMSAPLIMADIVGMSL